MSTASQSHLHLFCGYPFMLLATLLLSACTQLAPYRTTENPSADCSPRLKALEINDRAYGSVSSECAHLITENAPTSDQSSGYALNFVEFDDQGNLFPPSSENHAAQQMETFLDTIRGGGSGDQDLSSVVVFIHGWKHNAESDDQNVRWFRAMLDRIAVVEANAQCKRRVVGLFVGWRGDATSVTADVVKDVTFWTRKKAAEHVANGQVRELLSRLRAVQEVQNKDWNFRAISSGQNSITAQATREDAACQKVMRLTIVGHSFGGLIAYNALGPSLIRDMADLNERTRGAQGAPVDPVLPREGDLIVTINPAVEAATFVPLHLAAVAANPHSYHSPVFVSITSADDQATGLAFPAARFFNTLINRYPNGAVGERDAALETIGHDQAVVDYTLNRISILNQSKTAAPIVPDSACESLRGSPAFQIRFGTEIDRLDQFAAAIHAQPNANRLDEGVTQTGPHFFPRQFCRHTLSATDDAALALVPRPNVNLNSPVWNVYTAKPVVDDHSDLLNPDLVDFLRQLYEEGTAAGLDNLRTRRPPDS